MLYKRQSIIEFTRVNGPFWIISQKDGNSYLPSYRYNPEHNEGEMEQGIKLLEQVLTQISGRYKIQAAPIMIKGKTGSTEYFFIESPDKEGQPIDVSNTTGILGIGKPEDYIEKEIDRRMMKIELLNKDKQILELEKEGLTGYQEAVVKIGKLVDVFLPAIVQRIAAGQQAPKVAGTPPQPQQRAKQTKKSEKMTDKEYTEALQQVIEELNEADPKLLEHLQKIAELAKSKPQKFQSVIGMLEMM